MLTMQVILFRRLFMQKKNWY